jgi:hypothetical protein
VARDAVAGAGKILAALDLGLLGEGIPAAAPEGGQGGEQNSRQAADGM